MTSAIMALTEFHQKRCPGKYVCKKYVYFVFCIGIQISYFNLGYCSIWIHGYRYVIT